MCKRARERARECKQQARESARGCKRVQESARERTRARQRASECKQQARESAGECTRVQESVQESAALPAARPPGQVAWARAPAAASQANLGAQKPAASSTLDAPPEWHPAACRRPSKRRRLSFFQIEGQPRASGWASGVVAAWVAARRGTLTSLARREARAAGVSSPRSVGPGARHRPAGLHPIQEVSVPRPRSRRRLSAPLVACLGPKAGLKASGVDSVAPPSAAAAAPPC